MNMPKEEGRYLASPKEWGVEENTKTGTVGFSCLFALNSQWDGEQWVDRTMEDLEITGFFNLIKKDGQPNEYSIQSLRDALGWSGASFADLNGDGWYNDAIEVQLVLKNEEYEGKTRLKVRYLNPRDYEGGNGGVKKAADSEIQNLDSKYGPALRAINGGASAPAQSKPSAPKPTNPAPPAAKMEAWKAFQVKCKGVEQGEVAERWKRSVRSYFDGKAPDLVKDEEWRAFKADNFQKKVANPIGEEMEFKEEDIPF